MEELGEKEVEKWKRRNMEDFRGKVKNLGKIMSNIIAELGRQEEEKEVELWRDRHGRN